MAGINVYCFLNCSLLAWSYLCLSAAAGSQVRNIFILAGQSNMAGRGGVVRNARTGVASWDGVVPEICRSNPAILRLNAELDWVEAEEPLGQDIDVHTTCGVGPGMAFANTLLQMDPGIGVVGLVPCAVGGTSITEWARGGSLYSRMVKRALASVQYGGRIQGVLWYQGESDTINREDADRYKGRLEKFFMELRDDLQSPALPIIQVAIASGMGPYVDTVRHAQLGIDLVNVLTVDAKGLPFEPDMLHLSTPAEARLGEMLAHYFFQFLPPPPQSPKPHHSLLSGGSSTSHSLYRFCWFILAISLAIQKLVE
ncbi:hypothetical protein Nepgr_019643 [Nepenthes gracilis]|uniref:Sialate O-acetylesterase domain-containing protein n=1 Tax=Nepenthes gracilis TaxID=150966 RepID=A0AAD3XUB4_NEPGR|nr:hypothetical protein Nepgr_019643 [Nepenthes gracilis]